VRRLLVAAVAAALALPGAAAAHATMKEAWPGVQERIVHAPREVVLRFDQSVTASPGAIEVFAADGEKLSGPARSDPADGRFVRAPVARLERGAYTVRWRATSSDGHTVSGVFTFGVRVKPPPPTEAVGAGGPTWRDDVARWALFVALALLLGGLGLRLLVLPRELPDRLSRRLNLLAAIGVFAVIDAGILAFVLRAANALQLPVVDLLYGDLSPFATSTRFGVAFMAMTLGYGVCAAFVLSAWVLDEPRLHWPAFALGLALASGLSLSGHQASEPNSTALSRLADWLHLSAASLWVGGVVALAVCVWPAAPELRRRAFLGFSRLAVVLVALLVGAGTYLGVVRLPAFSDLWSTGYGRLLLLKLALVVLALAWGAAHHLLVRPRLERGEVPAGLRRSLLGESTVAVAVLLAAAVLVNSAPPPVESVDAGTEGAAAPAQAASTGTP
jgi:copper transport protein